MFCPQYHSTIEVQLFDSNSINILKNVSMVVKGQLKDISNSRAIAD